MTETVSIVMSEYEDVALKVIVTSKETEEKNKVDNANQNNAGQNNVPQTAVSVAESGNDDTAKAAIGKTYSISGYRYKVTGNDTVTVTGAVNKNIKTITVKNSVVIDGKTFKVTAIGNKAFEKFGKATKAVIGKNVKTIGKLAFSKCSKLKKITVNSSSINKVGANAFKDIAKKAVVKVPKKKLKSYKKLFNKKGSFTIR